MPYRRHSQLSADLDFFQDDNDIADNQETLYTDTSKYFDDFFSDIDSARETINLETFIFSNDFLAERVAHHLTDAAARGVKVRLLVDGMGAFLWHVKFREDMEAAGVEIKIFHPAPWRVWQWGYAINVSKFFLGKILNFISKSNSRNHRKVTVIDNKIAWIGSVNMTKQHLPITDGGEGWCDASLRLEAMDFSDLNLAFNAEWENKHYKMLFREATNNRHMRLNNTLFRRVRFQRNLFRKIRRSQRKIWITNAYFVPSNVLFQSLQQAAWLDVDVRIILPGHNNHRFMGLAGAMFYEKLIKAGVKVYLYQPGMIHEKSMIIDTWATVGSSNLNHRSLFRDLEVDVVLRTTHARIALENHFLDNIKLSKQITLSELRQRPWWNHLLGHFLLLWRYFL